MKEAKEKAEELVEKFSEYSWKDCNGWSDGQAIQCALICVDEIINDNPNIYDSDRLNYKYWQSVKEHLKQM